MLDSESSKEEKQSNQSESVGPHQIDSRGASEKNVLLLQNRYVDHDKESVRRVTSTTLRRIRQQICGRQRVSHGRNT